MLTIDGLKRQHPSPEAKKHPSIVHTPKVNEQASHIDKYITH